LSEVEGLVGVGLGLGRLISSEDAGVSAMGGKGGPFTPQFATKRTVNIVGATNKDGNTRIL